MVFSTSPLLHFSISTFLKDFGDYEGAASDINHIFRYGIFPGCGICFAYGGVGRALQAA